MTHKHLRFKLLNSFKRNGNENQDRCTTESNLCDNCSSELTIREDDKVEVVIDRLEAYHKQTAPLKDFYSAKGLLVSVEGKEELADTSAAVDSAIDNL